MTNPRSSTAQTAPRAISARTLATIRWMALAGQLATIVFVDAVLDFDVPHLALSCVGVSALLNIVLLAQAGNRERIGDREATAYHAFDVLRAFGAALCDGRPRKPLRLAASGARNGIRDDVVEDLHDQSLCPGLICTTVLAMVHLPPVARRAVRAAKHLCDGDLDSDRGAGLQRILCVVGGG